jgi:hypothetical protein
MRQVGWGDKPENAIRGDDTSATGVPERTTWRHPIRRHGLIPAEDPPAKSHDDVPGFFQVKQGADKRGSDHLPNQQPGTRINVSEKV